MPGRGRRRGKGPQNRLSQLSQSLELASLSTASLPPKYGISLAKAGPAPTADEYEEAGIRGSELISDVDKIDSLHAAVPLIPLPRRRGLWADDSSCAQQGEEKPAMWRTAGLSYPCTCGLCVLYLTTGNLPRWPRAYQFGGPAPTKLSPLETHPEPHQIPMLGDDMWSWSTPEFEELDLDPAMQELAEFETSWRDAKPWKGKGRAGEYAGSSPHAGPSSIHLEPPAPSSPFRLAPSSSLAPPVTTHPAPQDWQEDARDRRAWWRDTIEDDGGYGGLWDVLQRVTYPSLPGKRRRRPNIEPFRPASNLQSLSHPLHPDIFYYCDKAGTRVHWIIPIHGPVIIPRLNDPVSSADARPWPSRAELSANCDSVPDKNEKRPAVVRWTPASLRAFVHEYFEPTYRSSNRPYGALHLALSGPKPDPYLALDPPPPLKAHACLPASSDLSLRPPPVRPEAGDHLRIYCDASRAMILRKWLHSWSTGEGDTRCWPFQRARFTLVGPRGEALVVA